jgi:hypothetical protein
LTLTHYSFLSIEETLPKLNIACRNVSEAKARVKGTLHSIVDATVRQRLTLPTVIMT